MQKSKAFGASTSTPVGGPIVLRASVASRGAWRWVAVGMFVLANVLNFLDRQLLASLAPPIKVEFHLSNAQYGAVVSSFSLVYATVTPFAGLLVDRVGLNAGAVVAVGIWSGAGMATGLARSLGTLMACRGALGFGEAAALPFLSKATATYLAPSEWGLASAAGSLAVTFGSVAAPLMAAAIAPRYGWRAAFVIAGAMGVVWIGLCWLGMKRTKTSEKTQDSPTKDTVTFILTEPRMWRIIAAYGLVMAVLMLWLNWTTVFLVERHHLTPTEANRYFAWIPPLFVAAGGLFNGWLAFRWIRRGVDGRKARTRICIWSTPLFFLTAAIPFLPSAALAIGGVCLTLFACQCVIGSLNILPIDLFGPSRAAFTVSLLACSYSLMQTFVSPLIGASVDRMGFSAVCMIAAILPAVGIWIVRGVAK